MKKYLLPTVLILCFAVVRTSAEEGAVMPGFQLENMSGGKTSLDAVRADFSGPIILTFWASWCTPCKREMPKLQHILEAAGPGNLKIIAVSTDKPEKINKAKMFVKNKNFGFTFLFDPNGMFAKKKLHIPAVPHLVLLDGDDRMVYRHTGYKPGDEKELQDKVMDLLGRKPEKENGNTGSIEGVELEKSD